MSRSYLPSSNIELPQLNAGDALTLVRRLAAHAHDAGRLAATVSDALEDLLGTAKALRDAKVQRLARHADPEALRTLDRVLDGRWSALAGWLGGWIKHFGVDNPHAEQGPLAEAVRAAERKLFDDGLSWLNLPYVTELAESTARLAVIDREHLAATVHSLGGDPLLVALRAAHKAYADALVHADEPGEGTAVRDALDELLDALRHYVAAVQGTVKRKDAASTRRAASLLAPLEQWVSTAARGAAPADPATAPTAAAAAPEVAGAK